jgi:hypothetical protein
MRVILVVLGSHCHVFWALAIPLHFTYVHCHIWVLYVFLAPAITGRSEGHGVSRSTLPVVRSAETFHRHAPRTQPQDMNSQVLNLPATPMTGEDDVCNTGW